MNPPDMPSLAPLEYRPLSAREPRPRWIGRLGLASLLLGLFGIAMGVARIRQAWECAFDPTFKRLCPPPKWVDHALFYSTCAEVGVSMLLMFAGIVTLTRGPAVFRIHAWYIACKLPLVFLTTTLYTMQFWTFPDITGVDRTLEFLLRFGFFGAYAWFLIFYLRAKGSKGPMGML